MASNAMADAPHDRAHAAEHFIPYSRHELYRMLADDGALGDEHGRFEQMCQLLQSLYHFEFHARLEALKLAYWPFNPERDRRPDEPAQQADAEASLFRELEFAFARGNYKELPHAELEAALEGEGLLPVSLDVSFERYRWFRVFVRGRERRTAQVPGLLPWSKREVSFDLLDNVVLVLRFRSDLEPDEKAGGRPGFVYLKCLRGVPVQDLEMMFPDARPRMKLVHKLKVGVPAAAGIGTTLYKLAIAPFVLHTAPDPFHAGLSLPLVTLLAGLGGYVFKAWSEYKNTVQNFLSEVTTSLYFKNSVNNQGVFNTLIDTAEEEETKEAVLGYYFLLSSGEALSERDLDERVEAWFRGKHRTVLDFEVDDALDKLTRYGLVTRDDERYRAVPLGEALRLLDARWDQLFVFS